MRKTLMLTMFLAAGAFALLLTRPSPSQELDAGPEDAEWLDAGDEYPWDDEDAGEEDQDAGLEDLEDLIDAGFDPFVDAGPDPIPLPEDDDELLPPDDFEPPMQRP